ncbi:MAG: ATP-binding protein [Steroidobacteraceae bacterium]
MLERIEPWLDRLSIDLSKARLAWWLAGINALMVLLVVSGTSWYAIRLLRNMADAQGEARVQLAGAMAREELRRYGEDALTTARSVAATPTLPRLLREAQPTNLQLTLRRTCVRPPYVACAVFDGERLLAQAGIELPWPDIATAASEQGERFLAVPALAPAPLTGAEAQLPGRPEQRVYVVRLIDEETDKALSERAGVPIRVLNYRVFASAPVDDFTRLHSAGLSDGNSAVMRIKQRELYAASFPIFAATGEAIGLIEARLAAGEIDAAVGGLIKRLLISAVVLAALAVLAGVLLGQQVAGPVDELTQAAERLGQGDFSTSIPTGGTAEVGKLARTMEDMRNNLVDVTTTLRRSEAEAQAVLAGVVEGVFAVDKSRVIRYLNPQAARLLNVDAESAIGRFCGDVLKPCNAENGQRLCDVRCPILQARIEGNAQNTEMLNVRAGAPRTTVITSAAPVDNLQVQVIRDETELEGVRRARDSVLANISHEFRTPLAAQLASIELLRDGLNTLPPEQQHELVLSLERGTLRLTRLIDNLLESVRIESGQLGIRHQSVVLGEIVEDANALIGALLTQRRQQLQTDIPDDMRFDGDGPRLTQVFVNLLANSSKFAPEGSVVRVGARAEADAVEIWVEDEGPGVPQTESGSVFERFNRGSDQEPEPGGLGLGLWIVKSIIDRHAGTIRAERTVDNKTRFVISLPRVMEGAEA